MRFYNRNVRLPQPYGKPFQGIQFMADEPSTVFYKPATQNKGATYSLDYGSTWDELDNKTISLNQGDIMYVQLVPFKNAGSSSTSAKQKFTLTGKLIATGNLTEQEKIWDFEFDGLFKNQKALYGVALDCPNTKTVNRYGLNDVFFGTNIGSIPNNYLSSVESVDYYGCRCMFDECASLVEVGENMLYNVVNGSSNYNSREFAAIFEKCTALERIQRGFLHSLSDSGTSYRFEFMFAGCKSLKSVYWGVGIYDGTPYLSFMKDVYNGSECEFHCRPTFNIKNDVNYGLPSNWQIIKDVTD